MLAAARDLICFTGRFQPFHNDHLELVRYALVHARRVLVGVTNANDSGRRAHPASAHRHRADANPFSFEERRAMIVAALAADGVSAERYAIVPFPLEEPAAWPPLVAPGTPQLVRVFSDWEREKVRRFEAAGYPVLVLEGNPGTRLSASEIRRRIACGEDWAAAVPAGARELAAHWADRIRGALVADAPEATDGR
jgi:nicotinamide-nucleotide adenylyltransferase